MVGHVVSIKLETSIFDVPQDEEGQQKLRGLGGWNTEGTRAPC